MEVSDDASGAPTVPSCLHPPRPASRARARPPRRRKPPSPTSHRATRDDAVATAAPAPAHQCFATASQMTPTLTPASTSSTRTRGLSGTRRRARRRAKRMARRRRRRSWATTTASAARVAVETVSLSGVAKVRACHSALTNQHLRRLSKRNRPRARAHHKPTLHLCADSVLDGVAVAGPACMIRARLFWCT